MAKTLESSPSILLLYARAALPMIPGASLLPFVPGGGGEIPVGLDIELAGVKAEAADVAAAASPCATPCPRPTRTCSPSHCTWR
jgi:hypothetical protein